MATYTDTYTEPHTVPPTAPSPTPHQEPHLQTVIALSPAVLFHRSADPLPVTIDTLITSPNNQHWFKDDAIALLPIGGEVPFIELGSHTLTGNRLGPGSYPLCAYSSLTIFMWMFPPAQLCSLSS